MNNHNNSYYYFRQQPHKSSGAFSGPCQLPYCVMVGCFKCALVTSSRRCGAIWEVHFRRGLSSKSNRKRDKAFKITTPTLCQQQQCPSDLSSAVVKCTASKTCVAGLTAQHAPAPDTERHSVQRHPPRIVCTHLHLRFQPHNLLARRRYIAGLQASSGRGAAEGRNSGRDTKP